MASPTRKSLAGRATAAARKVVSLGSSPAAETSQKAPSRATGAEKEKQTAQKAVAKKAAPKKTVAKKTVAKKTPVKKVAPKKTAVKKTPAKSSAASQPGAGISRSAGVAAHDDLVVLAAETPWTKAELKQVQVQLNDDVTRLTAELAEVEEDLAGMIANSGEGAGNDQADVGSASFERDQEMVIVNNARDMLEQSQHALERIVDGSYGQCEHCGNPIGKNRLMAFPRATLCLTCKQREERR